MRLLELAVTLLWLATAVSSIKNDTRNKRQPAVAGRRYGGRPPPYAVQMEPIAHYSQRDPLYNPLLDSKNDDFYYEEPYGQPQYIHPSEPEPIIEIIIKESNESLPAPPSPPSTPKPKKEPIQVFYVKYEKKQEYGEDKPRLVYDKPVPALVPVEQHEEVASDKAEHEEIQNPVTQQPEPTTTLRTIIHPDSEYYHSGSSGIRVTFNTEQLPPNNHNKRSDKDAPVGDVVPTPGLTKRQHLGPFPPAFGQQRIVNSFGPPPQQILGTSQPPSFNLQSQFNPPPNIRNQYQPVVHQRPLQRAPITIQGLPEVQQRQPFNSFAPPHRNSPPFSHQNVQLQSNFPQQQQLPPNPPPANFNYDPQLHYKQQREQEKQRYFEQQRRQQEQKRIQEQQRLQDYHRQQEQQKQQELYRLQEQQRRKQEHEQQKLRAKQQQQQQQYQQQQQFQQQPQQQQQQQQFKFSQPEPQKQPQQQAAGEILKAIPKLEQHYSIRENPLHPGPFPPNPQYTEVTQPSYTSLTINNQYPNQQKFNKPQQQQQQQHYQQQQQQPSFQNQQAFFRQNIPTKQQQRLQEVIPTQQASIWDRPVFNKHTEEKIYATPPTKSDFDYKKYSGSTPNSIRYSPSTTPVPTTPLTTTTTTTTTTPSPRNEAKIKANIASLPDEVPDDIREQLLSSGILGNADIQILDYDKVGGINIGDLPPEALANFYGAGGAAATSASEPVPQIAKRPKFEDQEVQVASASSSLLRGGNTEDVTLRPGGVEMKVVRFDPNTAQGQGIAEKHINENATRLDAVALQGDEGGQYNRYLPLKVSGASFPIPSVPELEGKRISSVVVLAPVDYGQGAPQTPGDQLVTNHRQNRKIAGDVQAIRFLAGDSLKQLVKKPSAENYKRWLDQERQTEPQRQSVVLLVTTPYEETGAEEKKEIFMYDVGSESVSKLAGDLSTAFVDAAESNSDVEDPIPPATL